MWKIVTTFAGITAAMFVIWAVLHQVASTTEAVLKGIFD